jgi:DNA polymerase-3 subunit gamma/tau
VFVLATTEAHKVPPTIVDRCHRFDFHRPSLEQIAAVLRRVAEQEGIAIPDAAIGMIARAATGSFRDALGTLEQLVTYGGREVKLDDVLDVLGVADAEHVLEAAQAVAESDPKAALLAVQRLSESGRDLGQFMRDLSAHLRHLFVLQKLGEMPDSFAVTAAYPDRLAAQAERATTAQVVRAIELLATGLAAVKDGSDPRIQLELALLKATQPQADLSLQALMFRIEQLERRLGGAEVPEAAPSPGTSPTGPAGDGGARGRPPQAAVGMQAVAQAEPAEEPEATVAPELDLERIQTLWPAVADAVRARNGMVGALLAEASPTALEEGRLVVAFHEQATFHKKKAEANRALVLEALRGLTGRTLTVTFELSGDAAPSAAVTLSEDELVERLRREFGAEELFEDE